MAFADRVAAYQNTHLTLACSHRTSERPGRVFFCVLSRQAKYIRRGRWKAPWTISSSNCNRFFTHNST